MKKMHLLTDCHLYPYIIDVIGEVELFIFYS